MWKAKSKHYENASPAYKNWGKSEEPKNKTCRTYSKNVFKQLNEAWVSLERLKNLLPVHNGINNLHNQTMKTTLKHEKDQKSFKAEKMKKKKKYMRLYCIDQYKTKSRYLRIPWKGICQNCI